MLSQVYNPLGHTLIINVMLLLFNAVLRPIVNDVVTFKMFQDFYKPSLIGLKSTHNLPLCIFFWGTLVVWDVRCDWSIDLWFNKGY